MEIIKISHPTTQFVISFMLLLLVEMAMGKALD